MLAVDIGTGTTLTFGTSGWSAQITGVNIDDISRGSIDTTHLGTTASGGVGSRTFIPSDLSDPGGLSIEGHFDADTTPPIEGATETITVTLPLGAGESSPTTWAASGFMTNFAAGIVFEDKCTFTATIKFSGEITITPAT